MVYIASWCAVCTKFEPILEEVAKTAEFQDVRFRYIDIELKARGIATERNDEPDRPFKEPQQEWKTVESVVGAF